eukprot:g6061.t1
MSDESAPPSTGPLSSEVHIKSTHRNKALRKIYRRFTRVFKLKNNHKEEEEEEFEFDPELLCHQKKEWLDLRSVQDRGLEWPQHCFEHLVVVGLPHTMNAKEIVDTITKEKAFRKHSSSESIEKSVNHHCPPKPTYPPELLYQYPEDKPLHMESETLVSFCFPHGVTPKVLKRSSSMSDLNEVIYGQQHLVHSDQSFLFMQKGTGDDLPMFGVCYLVHQMLHTPPGLMKEKYQEIGTAKHLVSAPRCYCLLSRYPFFNLHFQVLNLVLGLERLDCISDYMNESIKLPQESPLFSDVGLKNSSRSFSSVRTPDSCAIRAFSASCTSQDGGYLVEQQQDYCGSELDFKHHQETQYRAQSTMVSSSDAESQTPKTVIHTKDSFSSIPELLSFPIPGSTHRINKYRNTVNLSFGEPHFYPHHYCCGCTTDELHVNCRECCLLHRLESERSFPLRGSTSAPIQRLVVRTAGSSPIPPRYPDHDHQISRGGKLANQELMESKSSAPIRIHQTNNNNNSNSSSSSISTNSRVSNLESFEHDSKSVVLGGQGLHSRSTSGQSLRECCESLGVESNTNTHCFVSCFAYQSMPPVMADSAYNPSSDFRLCSSSPSTPHHHCTRSGESEEVFFESTSMPDLSKYQHEKNNGVLASLSTRVPSVPTENLSSIFKCPSVGDIYRFPSTKTIQSWSENGVRSSSSSSIKNDVATNCQKLLHHFRELKVPDPGETIVFIPEEEGLPIIEYTRPIIVHQNHHQVEKDQEPQEMDHTSTPMSTSEVESRELMPPPRSSPMISTRLSLDLARIEEEMAMGLGTWTVAVLCRSLSLDNILTLLAGALLEKQIVFFCSNIGVLTSAVLSLLPLLQPFTWHSLILSVLPSQHLDLLDAPVPFAVGIQHKTPEIAQRCKDVIRVNLYKNKVKTNTSSHLLLPGFKTLHSNLSQWHKVLQESSTYSMRPSHVVTAKECNAVENFVSVLRGYLTGLIGDLKRHTITDVTSGDGVSLLLEESFLGAFPVRDQPFMKAFYQTQMFTAYVDTVIENYHHHQQQL